MYATGKIRNIIGPNHFFRLQAKELQVTLHAKMAIHDSRRYHQIHDSRRSHQRLFLPSMNIIVYNSEGKKIF